MNVTITQLSPDQWQEYCDLRLLAIKTDPFAFSKSYEDELALTEQQWRSFINNMWFALSDGQIIGMIGLDRTGGEPAKHNAFLISFWIKPEFRGKGIAKQMVAFLQDYCRNNGIRNLELQVTVTQKEAIALYEKMGFKKIATLKRRYAIQ